MFGFKFFKADPSTHVFLFKDGQIKHQGTGTSFFYFAPRSSLVAVPISSRELPFVFRMKTADFQDVTIQGQAVFRIVRPADASAMMNFAVNGKGKYESEDPGKLDERVLRSIQVMVRNQVESLTLRQALVCAQNLTRSLIDSLAQNGALEHLGIEINQVALTAISPSPETAKALEAEVRESLLKEADSAIYARRLASIDQEKQVKESELETERAIANKQQALALERLEGERQQQRSQFKTQQEILAADTEAEKQRSALVELEVHNMKAKADAQAYQIKASMEAYSEIDTERLKVMSMSGLSPEQLIAQSIENLTRGENKIGNLNLSPELLQSLMGR